MKRTFTFWILIASVAGLLSACSESETQATSAADAIQLSDSWARFSGQNGAAYVTIKNNGVDPDAVVAASIPGDIAQSVELHTTSIDSAQQMTMKHVSRIDVPARGQIAFEPGSHHVMIMGVKEEPKVGSLITLVLQLEKAGTKTIEAEVR